MKLEHVDNVLQKELKLNIYASLKARMIQLLKLKE